MSLSAHKKTAAAQIYEFYYSTTYQALWDREPQIRQASPDRVANMLAWETGMSVLIMTPPTCHQGILKLNLSKLIFSTNTQQIFSFFSLLAVDLA